MLAYRILNLQNAAGWGLNDLIIVSSWFSVIHAFHALPFDNN